MIKSEWIVSNMAARNALEVASADVYQGAECMVLSTGSVFRAVRAGTGATMWAGVVTESGVTTLTATAISGGTCDAAATCMYTRAGDIVQLSIGLTTVAATAAPSQVLVETTKPVPSPFTAFDDAIGTTVPYESPSGGAGGMGTIGADYWQPGTPLGIYAYLPTSGGHYVYSTGHYRVREG
jgi:hypothetical protein